MTRKRMLSNIVWMFIERVVVTLVVLASNVYVVRSLGVEDFGKLSYIQAILGIVMVLADCGLRRVLMVSFGKAASGGIVSAMLFIKSIAAAILGLACLGAYFWNGNSGFLALVLFCVFAPLEIYTVVLQAELRNDLLAKARTVLAIAGSGLRVWLCVIDEGTVNALLLTSILQSILIFVAAWLWQEVHEEKKWKISFKRFSRVWLLAKIAWSKSVYYFFSALVITAHYRIDQIMIEKISGSSELGIYSSAYKLVEQLLIIPGIISAVLLPAMAINRKNREQTKQHLSLIYGTTILVAILIAVPVMIIADPLVDFAFGSEFRAAGEVLFYLMLGMPFLFLANMSGLYFSVFGMERQAFIRNLCGLIVNVALNFYLIPLYGAKGAAISTIVSYAMVAVGADLIFWKRFKEHLSIKWTALVDIFTIKYYKGLVDVLRGK
jgi:O-antigen/teichoic acid export membrane protein